MLEQFCRGSHLGGGGTYVAPVAVTVASTNQFYSVIRQRGDGATNSKAMATVLSGFDADANRMARVPSQSWIV